MNQTEKLAFENALEIIERYMRGRCEPGSGIKAVLEGDLYESVRRLDLDTLACLSELALWIARHLPADTWGSREKVNAWLHPAPAETTPGGMRIIDFQAENFTRRMIVDKETAEKL